MKTPLVVHALFHSENKEGQRIYKELYSLLCRDVTDPFTDGLDIPVFFSTGDDDGINEARLSNSSKNLMLVFIDINMFCSERWREYIRQIMNKEGDETLVVGVKQYKHAFAINNNLGDIQSIVFDSNKDKDHYLLFEDNNWEVFTTQLFDLLIRFVSGRKDKEPLSVFISHSKWDENHTGEIMAEDVRNFLYSDTKLNSFFDVHDILDGYKFGNQIKDKVGKCSLLILFTDTYSSREWCRIEALTAKENRVPLIAVFKLDKKVDRVFPYIGNIPSISFDGDWRKVINLLLRTTLDQCFEKLMLSNEENETTEFLPYPPEAFNLSILKPTTEKLLYPEPPIGNEELSVLENICNRTGRKVTFFTPMSYLTENINLNDQNIAISISESGDLAKYGMGKDMLTDLTIEITRHILKANGKLIYGGDLRKDGYTELFRELAKQYGQHEKADADIVYIKNYQSWPLYQNITREQRAEYYASRVELVEAETGDFVESEEKKLYIPPTSLEDRLKWASSLNKMRSQMQEDSIARVILGGKTKGFSGYMAGVAEECKISLKHHQPVYILGGFGGAAHILSKIVLKNTTSKQLLEIAQKDDKYSELYDWCKKNGHYIDYEYFDQVSIADLNNGLTEEENKILFTSVDIVEIVSLLLKGLNNITK